MPAELTILITTAAALGLVHTVLGPDHYLPFIVLARARSWSGARTLLITGLCGLGHVLSSVLIGFVGIGVGVAAFNLEAIDSFRGEITAWLLIVFGLTYFAWGIRRAIRDRSHSHPHLHEDGRIHRHKHTHAQGSDPAQGTETKSVTPWVLFLIFVFGPCEPLIPVLMYPAAQGNMTHVAIVVSVFGLATIGTMISIVWASYHGLSKLPLGKGERYSHALAGLTIFLCGGAIKFLGL